MYITITKTARHIQRRDIIRSQCISSSIHRQRAKKEVSCSFFLVILGIKPKLHILQTQSKSIQLMTSLQNQGTGQEYDQAEQDVPAWSHHRRASSRDVLVVEGDVLLDAVISALHVCQVQISNIILRKNVCLVLVSSVVYYARQTYWNIEKHVCAVVQGLEAAGVIRELQGWICGCSVS